MVHPSEARERVKQKCGLSISLGKMNKNAKLLRLIVSSQWAETEDNNGRNSRTNQQLITRGVLEGNRLLRIFFFIMKVILEFTLRLEGIRFPATFVGTLHKNKLRGKEKHMQEVHISEFCTCFSVCCLCIRACVPNFQCGNEF